jgi:hypothetical protein
MPCCSQWRVLDNVIVDFRELPNYDIPPMDSIGTQEAIVDVTHDVVDFLSGCDTQPVAELNAWYHLLNCGLQVNRALPQWTTLT